MQKILIPTIKFMFVYAMAEFDFLDKKIFEILNIRIEVDFNTHSHTFFNSLFNWLKFK